MRPQRTQPIFWTLLALFLLGAHPFLSAGQLPEGRRDYMGLGIGTQSGGLLLDYRYAHSFADWFSWGLSANALTGIHDTSTSSDQFGTSYNNTLKGDVVPSLGTMVRFSIPRGFFRWLGLSLGIEGYHYNVSLDATDPASRKFSGSIQGVSYDANLDFISIRWSPADRGQSRLLTLSLDVGGRIGFDDKTILMVGPSGQTLTDTVYPQAGLYVEFLTGFRY